MISFLGREWRQLTLLLLSALWFGAFPIWSQWVTTDPLNTSISLVPPGLVNTEIQVRVPETYALEFLFERNGVSFDELKASIGAMGVCKIGEFCSKGVPVPVRWSITSKQGGSPVAGGSVESNDASGWSQAHVFRRIATVTVPPGRYILNAEVLRPVAELAKLRTHLAMQLQPKASATWQLALVWWGAIAQYVIALPIAVYSAIMLLWRANPTARSKGRA